MTSATQLFHRNALTPTTAQHAEVALRDTKPSRQLTPSAHGQASAIGGVNGFDFLFAFNGQSAAIRMSGTQSPLRRRVLHVRGLVAKE